VGSTGSRSTPARVMLGAISLSSSSTCRSSEFKLRETGGIAARTRRLVTSQHQPGRPLQEDDGYGARGLQQRAQPLRLPGPGLRLVKCEPAPLQARGHVPGRQRPTPFESHVAASVQPSFCNSSTTLSRGAALLIVGGECHEDADARRQSVCWARAVIDNAAALR